MRLSRGRIVDGDRVASPVHEQLLAWPVLLAQHQVTLLLPALVVMTETAVPIAVGMHGSVLFPQQLQGGVLVAPQFLMDGGEIRKGFGVRLGNAGISRKQLPL